MEEICEQVKHILYLVNFRPINSWHLTIFKIGRVCLVLDLHDSRVKGQEQRSHNERHQCRAPLHVLSAHVVNEIGESLHDVPVIIYISPSANKLGGKDLLHKVFSKGTQYISTVVAKLDKALSRCAESQILVEETLERKLKELLDFRGSIILELAEEVRDCAYEVGAL